MPPLISSTLKLGETEEYDRINYSTVICNNDLSILLERIFFAHISCLNSIPSTTTMAGVKSKGDKKTKK